MNSVSERRAALFTLFISLFLYCACGGPDNTSPISPKPQQSQQPKQPQKQETDSPAPAPPAKESSKFIPFIYSSSTRRAIRLKVDDASNTFTFETCKMKPDQDISFFDKGPSPQCAPI